jgi:DNA-binding NtrC family response regulator
MSIRVLLVDDEQSFAEMLSRRLEMRNFSVVSVSSGEDAVRLLHTEEFDVILLDVLMPGKSGIDTLKEIMNHDPLAHIIMLTGHARMDTAMEGMKLGAYDYLIKPTEIDTLVEKIRLANDHRSTEKEKQQKQIAPSEAKHKGWGKWVSPVSGFFQKQQRSRPSSSDDGGADKNKDAS